MTAVIHRVIFFILKQPHLLRSVFQIEYSTHLTRAVGCILGCDQSVVVYCITWSFSKHHGLCPAQICAKRLIHSDSAKPNTSKSSRKQSEKAVSSPGHFCRCASNSLFNHSRRIRSLSIPISSCPLPSSFLRLNAVRSGHHHSEPSYHHK